MASPGGASRSARAVTRVAATGTTRSLTGIQIEAFSGSGAETAGQGAVGNVPATGEPHLEQDALPNVPTAPHFSHCGPSRCVSSNCNPGVGGGGAPIRSSSRLAFLL